MKKQCLRLCPVQLSWFLTTWNTPKTSKGHLFNSKLKPLVFGSLPLQNLEPTSSRPEIIFPSGGHLIKPWKGHKSGSKRGQDWKNLVGVYSWNYHLGCSLSQFIVASDGLEVIPLCPAKSDSSFSNKTTAWNPKKNTTTKISEATNLASMPAWF